MLDEEAQQRRDEVVQAQAQVDMVMQLFTCIRPKIGLYILPGIRARMMEISDGLMDLQDEILRILAEEKF